MHPRNLRTFVAAATTLNLTRAAGIVHLAQSSVTEQIQALEAELGATLFERSPRGLTLTPAGESLLPYARDLLALAGEARAAVAEAAGVPGGTLVIGGLETLCARRLPALLSAFSGQHPGIALQLKSAGSRELREGLAAGRLDVSLTFGLPAVEEGIRSEVVTEEPLAVIVPHGHRLASRPALGQEDLAGEPFLVTERGCAYRRMFETVFPEGGPSRPVIVGEFGSLATILSLVETGMGCAVMPRVAIDESRDRVAILPWRGADGVVPVAMSWRRRRVQPQRLRLFIEAARAEFAALRPGDARLPHAAPSLS